MAAIDLAPLEVRGTAHVKFVTPIIRTINPYKNNPILSSARN